MSGGQDPHQYPQPPDQPPGARGRSRTKLWIALSAAALITAIAVIGVVVTSSGSGGSRARARAQSAPSPGMLTDSQLEQLLPRAGLPAEFGPSTSTLSYTDQTSGAPGEIPLSRPPAALSCSQIPSLEGTGLTNLDVNYLNVASLVGYSTNSDELDVVLDEPPTASLAVADLDALKAAAARCPTLTDNAAGLITTYQTVVTTVPGLGDQNVNIYMNPVSANQSIGPSGQEDILMVRVGGALVMVDYSLANPLGQTPGVTAPPVVAIARPIVAKL